MGLLTDWGRRKRRIYPYTTLSIYAAVTGAKLIQKEGLCIINKPLKLHQNTYTSITKHTSWAYKLPCLMPQHTKNTAKQNKILVIGTTLFFARTFCSRERRAAATSHKARFSKQRTRRHVAKLTPESFLSF